MRGRRPPIRRALGTRLILLYLALVLEFGEGLVSSTVDGIVESSHGTRQSNAA